MHISFFLTLTTDPQFFLLNEKKYAVLSIGHKFQGALQNIINICDVKMQTGSQSVWKTAMLTSFFLNK